MRTTERPSEIRKFFGFANARRVWTTTTAGLFREYDSIMTQHMRTNYEQLRTSPIDNVSGIVYSTDQLSRPQQGRQVYYGCTAKPHSHSAVFNMFRKLLLGSLLPFTQRVAKSTQTHLRKGNSLRSIHTRLRKEILNSFIMRKYNCLKEKQYGKKLNDRQ